MAVLVKKKEFTLGAVLTVTFFILLIIIHTTLIVNIEGKSVVDYTDELFVSISKGSVYFIPELIAKSDKYIGRPLDVKIKGDEKTALLFEKANAKVELKDGKLDIKGGLGEILKNILQDSDSAFKGEEKSLSEKYGFTGEEVTHTWWKSLREIEKVYKKAKKFEEIELLKTVRVKALEPTFNFYDIGASSASENALGIAGIVIFYVLYTVWWGFAVYFICEGFGLLMTKAKEKKEA